MIIMVATFVILSGLVYKETIKYGKSKSNNTNK